MKRRNFLIGAAALMVSRPELPKREANKPIVYAMYFDTRKLPDTQIVWNDEPFEMAA